MMDWRQFWTDYRNTTGGLTWRLAVADDLPAIKRLRNIAERFLQQPQRNPCLFDLPVLLALVAENEHGKIVECLYVEAQVELVKVNCSAWGFKELTGLEDDLANWLRSLGYRTVVASCQPRLLEKMRGVFEGLGFRLMDGIQSVWKRRL